MDQRPETTEIPMTNKNFPYFKEMVQTAAQLRAFAFFSANLRHLLPEMPYEKHAALFVQAGAYRKLADTLDRFPLDLRAEVESEGAGLLSVDRPGIFAAFHTGPYRLLGRWLASQGKPLTLLVSSDVAAKQEGDFDVWYKQCSVAMENDSLECLMAEDPMVFRKMMRALERGRCLLIYVDGQTGVRQQAGGSGSLSLGFLGAPLWVRTGVADLARLAQVPIYPLFAYFDEARKPVVRCLPALMPPDKAASRAEWTQHCMHDLYQRLEAAVRQRPAQWEGWLYIHHDLAAKSNPGGLLRYYMPFALHDRCFLLEKDSMAAYPISDELYEQIRKKCF